MGIYDYRGDAVNLQDIPFADVSALKYYFNDFEHEGDWNNYNNNDLFLIAHISDLHNDPVRYSRFLKFCHENTNSINVCAVTGDFVDAPTTATFKEMTDCEVFSDLDILKCVGNHEKVFGSVSMTNAQIYNNWKQTTNTGKLYYYKDYPSHGLRIIALNPFDTESNGDDSHYTQQQIDWFINTLKSAASNNYAVIILRHNFDGLKTVKNDKGFYQRWYQWTQVWNNLRCSGTPIEDIVHAFQTGGSISETYTYTDGVSSITVDTSFSGAGHFIAYLNGHYHADLTGFSPKYSDQLYLSVPQGALYSTYRPTTFWGEVSDLPRVQGTKTEDLFNLYAFDLKHKRVKICRVGSDVNDLLQERKMTTFQYNGESE